MKIIFLDIDGPMIPLRMYYLGARIFDYDKGSFVYDPVAVGMINKLCEENNAKVVFNSAQGENPIEVMRHQGIVNGLKYLHEDCKTDFPKIENRYAAIIEWFKKNGDVKNWIVIDDTIVYKPKQIIIDYDIGITMDNFIKANEMLGNIVRYPTCISNI